MRPRSRKEQEKAGNRPAALQHYRLVVLGDPNHVVALNNLAFLLVDFAKNPDEALPHAEKACQLAPDSAPVNDTLGWVYYQKGIYKRAVNHMELAVKFQPTAKRKAHLALAYHKLGDERRAKSMLQEAVKMEPNLPEVQEASRLLASK